MTKTISSKNSLFIVTQNVTNFHLIKDCLGTALLQKDNLITSDTIA